MIKYGKKVILLKLVPLIYKLKMEVLKELKG
jgi:hypothetical protein